MKSKKILLMLPALCMLILLAACGPVNRLTRTKKVPRNYSVNYSHGNVKSKYSELNRKAWIVYSDRGNNTTTVLPGGSLAHTELKYMEPMLVIGSKGDYYKLIKYDPSILKNEKLSKHKEAVYYGWMHKDRLLLFNNSETEVRNDIKLKNLAAITDCRVMLEAEKYFSSNSLILYSSPEMREEERCGSVALNTIVYVLKRAKEGTRTLISLATSVTPDEAEGMVSGWVESSLIAPFGQRLAINPPPDTAPVSPSPALYAYRADSRLVFRTLHARDIIDHGGNRVYNVDGNPITYEQGKRISSALGNINVILAFIPTENVVKQLPAISNAVQNLKPIFDASPKMFNYNYAAVVGRERIPFTGDYFSFGDRVMEAGKDLKPTTGTDSFIPVLREALSLAATRPEATNIIVLVGETAPRPGSIPPYMLDEFSAYGCRLLGYQVYAGREDVYNNFVLQSLDIVESYSEATRKLKRSVIVYPDQLRRKNLFVEGAKNAYALDFPKRSMTQGMVVFPEKGRFADAELLINSVDSLARQVESDNLTLTGSLDRAFAQVGTHRSHFQKETATSLGIDPKTPIAPYLGNAFTELSPRRVSVTDRISLPVDSTGMSGVGLLLTGKELEDIASFVEKLAEVKPDIKGEIPRDPAKFHGVRRVRRELRGVPADVDSKHTDDVQPTATYSLVEVKYAPTGKIRKHIQRTYLKALRSCVIEGHAKRLTLAQAQEYITTMPTASPQLNSITLKDLKKKRRVTDAELDSLIRYFEERKQLIDELAVPVKDLSKTDGEKFFFLPSGGMP